MGVEGGGKRKLIVPQIATESAGLPLLPLSHRRRSVQASQHYGARQSAEPDFWEPARFAQLQQEAKSKSQSASLQTPRHPISWERELQQNYKPCIFILLNPGGDFQTVYNKAPRNQSEPLPKQIKACNVHTLTNTPLSLTSPQICIDKYTLTELRSLLYPPSILT